MLNDWIEPNHETIVKFKVNRHYLRLRYYNEHNRKANLVLNHSTIPKIIKTEPQNKPQLSDMCEACGQGTNQFSWIEVTTESGETIKQKRPIHLKCYQPAVKCINYILDNHSEKLVLEKI